MKVFFTLKHGVCGICAPDHGYWLQNKLSLPPSTSGPSFCALTNLCYALNCFLGSGEMAPQLRALATLPGTQV